MKLYEKIKSRFFPNKKKLYKSLQMAWNDMGEKEPFYSVVTNDQYKMENFDENQKEHFYFSEGSKFLTQYVNLKLRKHLKTSLDAFSSGRGLDFGCGVGRNTVHLSPYFKNFVGLDISQRHLNQAQKICDEKGLKQVEFYKSSDDILSYGSFDFIFSVITLQHIPPPLMKSYIDQLLQMLKSKGIAFLHLPTEAKGYKFFEKNYFFKKGQKLSWSMHVLAQPVVEKLIKKNKCQLIHLDRELDLCEGKWKSAIFLIRKD